MRKQVGILVAACLYYSGLVKLARRLMQRSDERLIILNYHRATGGNLRRHLLYLRSHYRVLHLEEALQELYATRDPSKQRRDRRTPLVLTFDDGYVDNYTGGFALARELQVPITIFLIPGYIESGDRFWWLEGQHLAQQARAREVTLAGSTYCLTRSEERAKLAQYIDTHLWSVTSVAERETFLTTLRELLDVPTDGVEDKVGDGERSLSWAEVREMDKSGVVSFGAHTMHHPILAHLTDTAEIRREVSECREVLQQRLHHPVRAFAYPVGRTRHIGEAAILAVQEAGYDWAVTTMSGINTRQSDPYQLHRVLGDVSRHWLVMAAEVSGVWSWFSPLWKNHLFNREETQ
ncbi:MAG TPA: polysaccharide deacetylase family protein [Ktedonobacteraceae bacterium]|nr:polysaccharide deacetylase family protein [Ktedonobacteraceae bacterium]